MSSTSHRTLAFVFARGGSKGIPKKNLQLLGDKPLIAHAILTGLATPGVERVIVSTDCAEIASVAKHYGAEIPFLRPPELSTDSAPELLAWKHAIEQTISLSGSFDIFLSLPATSPLRNIIDVTNVLGALAARPDADGALCVQPASRNPYFNMVVENPDGFCSLVCRSEQVTRRQDAPRVFDLTTVAYAFRVPFLLRATSLFDGNLLAVNVPRERAVDIDDPLELEWARYLHARTLLAT